MFKNVGNPNRLFQKSLGSLCRRRRIDTLELHDCPSQTPHGSPPPSQPAKQLGQIQQITSHATIIGSTQMQSIRPPEIPDAFGYVALQGRNEPQISPIGRLTLQRFNRRFHQQRPA